MVSLQACHADVAVTQQYKIEALAIKTCDLNFLADKLASSRQFQCFVQDI